ncbi:uncharacterized protein LTR77_009508 [Saxophila tyrrhenica]|uniref:Uncharacterized protein n=1 Tax=Saxophila tyrrhenica TaxID=1690608 RepID=A0AAV9P0L5_9PEZI|nr:hypothetical protein LTR77_009508 [Saxophila tyrrhenica]
MAQVNSTVLALESPQNACAAIHTPVREGDTAVDEKNGNQSEHTEATPSQARSIVETGHAVINEAIAQGVAANIDDSMTLFHEADEANSRERGMKLREAFRIYPKAITWSIILSSTIIMEDRFRQPAPIARSTPPRWRKQATKGTRYWECFKGTDRRRTELVCMTWIAQTLSGTVVGGLSSFFYTSAEISTPDAYSLVLLPTKISIASAAETKGRTYAQLDILFANKTSSGNFAKTRIDNLVAGTETVQKEQVLRTENPKEIAVV